MKALWEIVDLLRTMRRKMRFGELSRAPLQLLRLEWRGDTAQCDWMVRPPDLSGIRSVAMRVKMYGLQFRMDDGKLAPLDGAVVGR